LPQLKADTDVFHQRSRATTRCCCSLVAKGLLTEYRDHVGDLDTLEMIRFVTEQVVDAIAERTAARTIAQRFRDPSPDNAEWPALAAGRSGGAPAGRAGAAAASGRRPGRRCVRGVQRRAGPPVGRRQGAHGPLGAGRFDAGLARCSDQGVRALLARVRSLYALSVIEADRGWFAEHGRLTASQTKAVIASVNELCRDLRPHAGALIDGFGIPDAWLDAAMLREA